MFLIRDHNPTQHAAVVTYTLIALNVRAWVSVQGLGAPGPLAQSLFRFGVIPGELLGTVDAGA